MKNLRKKLYENIEKQRLTLTTMADDIFDNPEAGLTEYRASTLLCDKLRRCGFEVEQGICGLPTAFRAVFTNGTGGPSIGLLCEYDAIEGFGHACGHHLQGPAITGAATAIKEELGEHPFRLVVYGTPAEETVGGKIIMQEGGAFQDIDIALMMHGAPTTCVDVKSMALQSCEVTFHGTATHAAIDPAGGRSALDALLLAANGVEFMREHTEDDTRLHYTILDAGGPSNKIPCLAKGEFTVRSYDTDYILSLYERLLNIFRGAALMADVDFEVKPEPFFKAKIPVLKLNELIMENAEKAGAPAIRPPREKTGSTDFGNLMYELPGSCIRVAFVEEGTSPHSQAYLDAGKSEAAHNAIITGAKVLAGVTADLIYRKELLSEIQAEFRGSKEKAKAKAQATARRQTKATESLKSEQLS